MKITNYFFINKPRRRIFLTMIIVALIFVMLLMVILLSCDLVKDSSMLVQVKPSNTIENKKILGYGINLNTIPLSNAIKDASFEESVNYQPLTIADYKDNSIFFSTKYKYNKDSEFKSGNTVNIMEVASNGSMVSKYQGKIEEYYSRKLDSLEEASTNNRIVGILDKEKIEKIVCLGDIPCVLTQKGRIISDFLSDNPQLVFFDNLMVDMVESDGEIIAVDESGKVYVSNDGVNFVIDKRCRNFTLTDVYNEQEEIPSIIGLVKFNDSYLYATSDGSVITVSGDNVKVEKNKFPSVKFFRMDGDSILVITDDGRIYITFNGVLYQEITDVKDEVAKKLQMDSSDVEILDVVSKNHKHYINDSKGIIYTINSSYYKKEYDNNLYVNSKINNSINTSSQQNKYSKDKFEIIYNFNSTELNIVLQKMMVCGNGELLLEDGENGDFYLLSDSNVQKPYKIELNGQKCDAIFTMDMKENSKVIMLIDGKFYYSSIYAEVVLDSPLGDGVDVTGDICIIGNTKPSVNLDSDNFEHWVADNNTFSWEVCGPHTKAEIIDSRIDGLGNKALSLVGEDDGLHVISQRLGNIADVMSVNSFYKMQLFLKQEGIDDNIKVWLSATPNKNDSDITNDMKKYEEGFVISDANSHNHEFIYRFAYDKQFKETDNMELRFNIAFEGSGTVTLDGIYFGLDKEVCAKIPDKIMDELKDASPDIIRFNNLSIGRDGFSDEATYSLSANSVIDYNHRYNGISSNNCTSLEECLELSRKCEAIPWLTIGSSADAEMINNFISYICGSTSQDYGKKRMDNGTALPWIRQFSSMIIEINDADGIFESDNQKMAYINYIISLFNKSEYYSDFRMTMTFVDGMKYSSGKSESNADYHSGEFEMKLRAIDDERDLSLTNKSSNISEKDWKNTDTFIKEIEDAYSEYSSKMHTSKDNAELISSLNFQLISNNEYKTLSDLNASEILSLLMNRKFQKYSSVLLNLDLNESFLKNNISDDKNKYDTLYATLSDLEFAFNAEKYETIIDPPFGVKENTSVDVFNSYCVSGMYKKNGKLYMVVSNTSSGSVEFALTSDVYKLRGSEYSRYNRNGKLMYSKENKKQSSVHTLQSGEFVVFEIKN